MAAIYFGISTWESTCDDGICISIKQYSTPCHESWLCLYWTDRYPFADWLHSGRCKPTGKKVMNQHSDTQIISFLSFVSINASPKITWYLALQPPPPPNLNQKHDLICCCYSMAKGKGKVSGSWSNLTISHSLLLVTFQSNSNITNVGLCGWLYLRHIRSLQPSSKSEPYLSTGKDRNIYICPP